MAKKTQWRSRKASLWLDPGWHSALPGQDLTVLGLISFPPRCLPLNVCEGNAEWPLMLLSTRVRLLQFLSSTRVSGKYHLSESPLNLPRGPLCLPSMPLWDSPKPRQGSSAPLQWSSMPHVGPQCHVVGHSLSLLAFKTQDSSPLAYKECWGSYSKREIHYILLMTS